MVINRRVEEYKDFKQHRGCVDSGKKYGLSRIRASDYRICGLKELIAYIQISPPYSQLNTTDYLVITGSVFLSSHTSCENILFIGTSTLLGHG